MSFMHCYAHVLHVVILECVYGAYACLWQIFRCTRKNSLFTFWSALSNPKTSCNLKHTVTLWFFTLQTCPDNWVKPTALWHHGGKWECPLTQHVLRLHCIMVYYDCCWCGNCRKQRQTDRHRPSGLRWWLILLTGRRPQTLPHLCGNMSTWLLITGITQRTLLETRNHQKPEAEKCPNFFFLNKFPLQNQGEYSGQSKWPSK